MLAIIMTIEDPKDRSFVTMIYNKYSEKMYLTAFKILNDHSDAQDCVHDTVERIICAIETFKEAESKDYLDRLVLTCCENMAINKYNENKRRHQMEFSTSVYDEEDREIKEIDIPSNEPNIENIVISEQNCRYVEGLINRLDRKYKDVILLKSAGASNSVIASTMGISEALVRQRYLRARNKIIEMGGDELYEIYGKR